MIDGLSCFTKNSRSASFSSDSGPIDVTHPSNKKLRDKLEKKRARKKNELLGKKGGRAKKMNGKRSGKITKPQYRIIVNK